MPVDEGVVTPDILIGCCFSYRILKNSIQRSSALSLSKYLILLELQDAAANASSTTIGNMAQKLALTSSAISIAVRDLKEARLVSCLSNKDDHRSVSVDITAQGISEIARINIAVVEALTFILQPLSPRQRREMLSNLLKAVSTHKHLQGESWRPSAEATYAKSTTLCFHALQNAIRLHRISMNEATVLFWLSRQSQSAPLSEVSRAVLLKLNYLVQVSNKLVSRKLAVREAFVGDRRIVLLASSDTGKERMQRIQKDMDKAMRKVFPQLSFEDLEYIQKSNAAVVAEEMKRNRYNALA